MTMAYTFEKIFKTFSFQNILILNLGFSKSVNHNHLTLHVMSLYNTLVSHLKLNLLK